eukprot:CAMPEP_0119273362 /NCGR_PEP_ID=MMETSP1329-20130426/10121_1 /TAXON_ID=114041 /ORGANISM="Genus nov. species nov., Strain RCC1024" /LENGTH=98 /DNA_ID=CAMNT_0007273561 /DNA_START=147 /DNA_END=443 /DNA_ORIENTATION=-
MRIKEPRSVPSEALLDARCLYRLTDMVAHEGGECKSCSTEEKERDNDQTDEGVVVTADHLLVANILRLLVGEKEHTRDNKEPQGADEVEYPLLVALLR